MVDVAFIMIAAAFVLICVAYVRGLDRMIGPDAPYVEDARLADAFESEVAAR